MTTIEKIKRFAARYATYLLVLAVVLTAGAAMRTSAFAKYNSYLYDMTSAVAGDFYVTSNYLSYERPSQHAINFWDGETYEIPVRVRNYENSLRFNHVGTDFFYTIDAAVYKDPQCTEEIDDTFNIAIYYGDASDKDLAATKTEIIEAGKTKITKYGLMRGTAEYSVESGEQIVTVSSKRKAGLQPLAKGDGSRYLKITLHTVPLTEVDNLTLENDVTYTTSRGVYYTELVGIFALSRSDDKAMVETEYHAGAAYSVSYNVKCNSGDGSMKIYYPSEKVVPDSSLGMPAIDEKGTYVTIDVTEGRMMECYFFRKSMDDDMTPLDSEFSCEVNTGIITDDPTHYQLTGEPGTMMKFLVDGTERNWALAGQNVVVAMRNSDTHVPKAVFAKPVAIEDFYLPVTPVADKENQYQFQMPRSNVAVSMSFRYTTKITIMPNETDGEKHGTIAIPAPADIGDSVSLSVTADEGYELDTLEIKKGADTVNYITLVPSVAYSFTMPEGGVTVTASFKAVEADSGE